jgi:phosphinothricin acetyltransferase
MSDLTFRPATQDDAPELLSIYNPYVETSTVTFDLEPWAVGDMKHKIDAIARLGMPFIVAELDGDVVGYAYLSTWRDKCAYETTMENTIYLRDDSRGMGIGGVLLEELCRLGAERGVREVIAVTGDTADAAPSVRIHERHGFERVSAMANVGFKFDRWIGVIMLQRTLTA